jgi:hypothetical protein
LIAIAGGGGVNLFNSQGNPWTPDYFKITGIGTFPQFDAFDLRIEKMMHRQRKLAGAQHL